MEEILKQPLENVDNASSLNLHFSHSSHNVPTS